MKRINSYKKIAVIILYLACFLVQGCAIFSRTTSKMHNLSPAVQIQEKYLTKWFPYSGSGHGDIIPLIPTRIDKLINQTVLFNGKKVWEKNYPWMQKDDRMVFYLSPDGSAIYIEHDYHNYSSLILHLREDKIVEIELPYELSEPAYTYPLWFVEWAPDSGWIKVRNGHEGMGLLVNFKKVAYMYKVQWKVDAFSGKVKKLPGGTIEKIFDIE